MFFLFSSTKLLCILGKYLAVIVQGVEPPIVNNPSQSTAFGGTNFIKRALESRSNRTNSQSNTYRSLGNPDVFRIMFICSLYHTALNTLTQMKLDILTGKLGSFA